jgi:hypothetical protein
MGAAQPGQDSTALNQGQKKQNKLNLYFSFDIRRSLVRDVPVGITGLKLGITIKKRHSIGIGYYNMGRPIFRDYYVSNPVYYDAQQTFLSKRTGQNVDVDTRVELSIAYFSLFYEYRILAHRKWNIDLTLQSGFGEAYLVAFNKTNGRLLPDYPRHIPINLIEGSVLFQYKIFTWFGAGLGVGYRNMLNPSEYVTTTFNYPIWVVKLMIFPAKIWQVTKGKEKWYH